jgi:hypothetical protein
VRRGCAEPDGWLRFLCTPGTEWDRSLADDVTRQEFLDLAARVDVLEREVEGEKMVTRHILEQTRRNADDLAAIKSRLERVERKVDGLASKVSSVDQKIDDLARTLPDIVGEAVREVLREREPLDAVPLTT